MPCGILFLSLSTVIWTHHFNAVCFQTMEILDHSYDIVLRFRLDYTHITLQIHVAKVIHFKSISIIMYLGSDPS